MDYESGNRLKTRKSEYSKKQLKRNWPRTKLGTDGHIVRLGLEEAEKW